MGQVSFVMRVVIGGELSNAVDGGLMAEINRVNQLTAQVVSMGVGFFGSHSFTDGFGRLGRSKNSSMRIKGIQTI